MTNWHSIIPLTPCQKLTGRNYLMVSDLTHSREKNMNEIDHRPLLVTQTAAAKILGVSYQHLRSMIREGKLPIVRTIKAPRVPYQALVDIATPKTN
jgi:excisionase family DNA binding protein